MITGFVGLPIIVGVLLSVAAASFLGFFAYAGARFLIGGGVSENAKQLATSMFTVIATLVSLMLSLTFADFR